MEQLAVPPEPVGLHVVELNDPESGGLSVNVTWEVGVSFEPALVSVIVAVHVTTV